MITKEQLNSIGYYSTQDNQHEYIDCSFDYLFNIKSQELWFINDGYGKPKFLCKCTDINKLITLLETNP